MTESRSVRAERVGVNYDPTQLQLQPSRGKGKGRICAEPECKTILSAYNRANTCWIHTAPREAGFGIGGPRRKA